MDKLEYLKYALDMHIYKNKSWIVTAFATTREITVDTASTAIAATLHRTPWGFMFYNAIDNKWDTIKDSKTDGPLYNFTDQITIDNTWAKNVKGQITTWIGNILFNAIAIEPVFGTKMDFITGRVNISKIEDIIAAKSKDTPEEGEERSTEYFYMDEYIKFADRLTYISDFAQITCWAATRKNIVAPVGIREFKAKLNEEFKGKLQDPIELAKYEKRLMDFDSEYLKDDPSDGKFVEGKIKDVCRKKMFLNMGTEKSFDSSTKAKPIINSLDEGWPTDPEQFAILMNGSRFGSYSRGAETVKGGVAAKQLLRVSNNFKIVDQDCGTKLGIRRTVKPKNIGRLINNYLVTDKGPVLIPDEETAKKYLDRPVILRSFMYCKIEGDAVCKYCAGQRLSRYPTGLAIPVTEITNIILYQAMKAMHAQVLSTAKLNLNEILS